MTILYRAIHTPEGEIRGATYVNDDIDLAAESASYAAQGLSVAAISAEDFSHAQAAVADDSYYIDYVGIDETPTLIQSPPRPGEYYDFNFTTHVWEVSAARLEQAKEAKAGDLSEQYRARRNASVLYGGNPYSPTDDLVRDIRTVITCLEYFTTAPAGWSGVRALNGARSNVEAYWSDERDNLAGMLANIELRRAVLLSVYYNHLDGIAAAATVEAVLAYDVTTGWPT